MTDYNKRLILDGKTHRRVRDSSVIINDKLTAIWEGYKNNEIGTMELLSKCSKVYSPSEKE
ncbi:hypothetical protein ACF0H5_010040 [Mactra antiquata]